MPEHDPLRRSRSAELTLALLLAVGGAVVARFFFQERMLVDGAGLATFFARGDRLAYHFLYLPACRVVAPLAGLVAPGDPIEATRLLSAIAFGAGVAFTYLFVSELEQRRRVGAGTSNALFGTLLVAFSPAATFFATTVEVHALHFATIAFASWAMLRLPWRSPALATAGAAALFGLVFWAHQMGLLLGPGWVLLCGLCARWAGRPLSVRALVLGVGPALLAGDLLASGIANYVQTGSLRPSAEDEVALLVAFNRLPDAWRFGWDGWLKPLAFVVPLAILGVVRGAFAAGVLVALAVLVIVPTAFLFAWGVAEHGGYTLGQAPFLAALAAAGLSSIRFPERWIRASVIGAVLAAQLGISAAIVAARGRGFDVEERVELVAEHLQGGTFLATAPNAPSITLYLPDAFEIVIDDALIRGLDEGREMDEIAALLLASARVELARTGRLVLDLGYETQTYRATIRRRLPVLEPLRGALEREFTTTRVEHRDWPLLIVEPRER